MTTPIAVINPRSNARLSRTSMNPSLKKPNKNANNPTWRVVIVETAMPIASGLSGCSCGSEWIVA